MHSNFTTSILPCFLALLFANPSNAQLDYPLPHPEGYVAYQTSEKIIIDGYLDEESWGSAEWSNSFVDIEGDKKPKPYLNTQVKMMWDAEYFYFAADLEEPKLWATIKERDAVIFYDNDIEIFIDPNGDTHGYYELEMNAYNTLWDLLLPKPYREGGPAIDHWDINGIQSAVALYGTLNDPSDIDEKWTVEVAIPWDVLEEYAWHRGTPMDGEQWRISFSRVHYDLDDVENKYRKRLDDNGKTLPEYNWTWTPQWVINMHRPETWGYVQFEQELVGSEVIPFKADKDFDLKMALFELYFQQKVFYEKMGHYSKELSCLPISDYNRTNFLSLMKLEALSNKYIIQVNSRTGRFYTIDETGKLTLQRFNE